MLEDLRKVAVEGFVPILRDESSKILQDLCNKNQPKNILEIGTAIGYSGMIMLNASKDGHLTTIEKNEERYALAIKNFDEGGFSDRVDVILGDAMEVLEKFAENNRQFDFIFLDGPKGQYVRYLPYLKKLLSVGGVLFADNIYFRGLVKSEGKIAHKHRTIVNNLRLFIKNLEGDMDLNTQFLDIEDGMSISKRIK